MDMLRQKTENLINICRREAERTRVVVTGHDNPDADSVISAVMMKRLLAAGGVPSVIAFPTPPDNVTLRDMKTLCVWNDAFVRPFADGEVLLLVDHHKTFYKNEVLGCVDHHTTPPEPDFEFCYVAKASSCGKMIYDMMCACGVATELDERLALYSVYLDTQSCKSSKFKKWDAEWIAACIEKYGLDAGELEKMGYCLNSPDEPADVVAMYAYKRYEFGGAVCASTAIQIDVADGAWDGVIAQALRYLSDVTLREGYRAWAFVVNKPEISRSDIYWIYPDGRVERLELDRLASRSRDVIPVVSTIYLNE